MFAVLHLVERVDPRARASANDGPAAFPARDLATEHRPLSVATAESRAALLAVAGTLSPTIEDTAPGVATADVSGLEPSRREPALHAAVERLAALGYEATAGLAATPLLALYAARAAALPASASEGRKVSVRAVSSPREFLAGLPLDYAAPSPALAEILGGWGVRTLGEVLALPRAEMVRRLGAEGAALYARAEGAMVRPLRAEPPPVEFVAAHDLEHSVETLEPLLFVLRRAVERLALDLMRAHCAAAALELRLALEDGTAHVRTIRLPEPASSAELLFRTLRSHLDTVRTAAPVGALRLRIVPTRQPVRQTGLFDAGLRDPHSFAETLARTVAVVGEGRVGTPVALDTHRPDAFALVPPPAVVPLPGAPPVHAPVGLALRRYRPARPARVERAADGAPVAVWRGPRRLEVAAARGPWRDAGEWWAADRAWRGEEWDVELAAAGGLYRLRRTREGWYWEGEYD